MRDFLLIPKALADENRLRILVALDGGELCLCQLIDLLGLAPSTVSKHISLLHQAGLVERRKEGRWHFYRPADDSASAAVVEALAWVRRSLNASPVVLADAAKLGNVRQKDLEELSTCYRG